DLDAGPPALCGVAGSGARVRSAVVGIGRVRRHGRLLADAPSGRTMTATPAARGRGVVRPRRLDAGWPGQRRGPGGPATRGWDRVTRPGTRDGSAPLRG